MIIVNLARGLLAMLVRRGILISSLLVVHSSVRADAVTSSIPGVVRVIVVAEGLDGQVSGLRFGTGFAVSSRMIVTNAHVVRDPEVAAFNTTVLVIPSKARGGLVARVKDVEPGKDLALLEVQTGALSPLIIYNGIIPDGAPVAALGYPSNVDRAAATTGADFLAPTIPTRSQGNYSNPRLIEGINSILHTAPISRGNSGGPLLDDCGRVVGVNTYTTGSGAGDAQFSFAVSSGELSLFLRRGGLKFNETATSCLSAGERAVAAVSLARAAAERKRAKRVAHEAAVEAKRYIEAAKLRRIQENWIAASIIAGIVGLTGMFAGGLFFAARRMKSGSVAFASGLLFLGAGAAAYFGRPDEQEPGASLSAVIENELSALEGANLSDVSSDGMEASPSTNTTASPETSSVSSSSETPIEDDVEVSEEPPAVDIHDPSTSEQFDTNGL